MKLQFFRKRTLFILMVMAIGLVACSSEEPKPAKPDPNEIINVDKKIKAAYVKNSRVDEWNRLTKKYSDNRVILIWNNAHDAWWITNFVLAHSVFKSIPEKATRNELQTLLKKGADFDLFGSDFQYSHHHILGYIYYFLLIIILFWLIFFKNIQLLSVFGFWCIHVVFVIVIYDVVSSVLNAFLLGV